MNQMTKIQNRISPKKAAVFLDRDGTIIHDRGYIKEVSEVIFYPQTLSALQLLQPHFEFFIITNQMGIAKGILEATEVKRVNQHVSSFLANKGLHIQETYVCPRKPEDNCFCRKPKPFFLKQAAKQYDIALNASFTIGDHLCDTQLAENAGAQGVYVLTGHGQKHRRDVPPKTAVVADILAAALYILFLRHQAIAAETFVLDLIIARHLWQRPELGPPPEDTELIARVLDQAGITVLHISCGWLECEFRPIGIWEALTGLPAPTYWAQQYQDSYEEPGQVLDMLDMLRNVSSLASGLTRPIAYTRSMLCREPDND